MPEKKSINTRIRYLAYHLIIFAVVYLGISVSCSHAPEEFLTKQEIEWLYSQKQFDLVWGQSSPPEVFYDETGEYVGLLVDMKDLMEKHLDYSFNFINVHTWDSIIRYAEQNKDYIVIGVARTKYRETFLKFTDPLIKMPYVIVTRRDSDIKSMKDLDGKKVCAVRSYSVLDYVEEYFSHIKPFEVDNEVSGLRAVSLGQYDAMLVGQLYCTYIIESEGISNLKIAGETGYINRLCVGVSRKNPKLFEIMDKTVNHIDKSKRKEIYEKWVTGEKELSPRTLRLIVIVISLTIGVMLLLWTWLLSLKRQVNRKTKQIRESESKYRLLIENSHDAIYQLYNGKFIMMNKQFEELFGYSIDTLTSKDFDIFTLIAPESKENIKNLLDDFHTLGIRPKKYEFIGITKNKEKRYLDVSVSYLSYKDGVASQGIIRDITERKQKEYELIEAKNKAEESDRLKSAFLANMSHEIRTPMNGILGFADLLGNPDISGDEQKKFLDVIKRSGERMLNTINDIIDVSRIETGQVIIHESNVDINMKMSIFYNFFKAEADKKDIKLSYITDSENEELYIKTDENKFESILTNLLKNAIKFTEKGKIEFGYKINQDWIYFYVIDTGRGIPKERQNAIFNRFEQADIEDKEALQGSGLGLSIAKAYVEMLGGNISVESEEGIGSKFYFTLPYLSSTKNNNQIVRENKNKGTELPCLKLLVVEDDKVSASFLKIISDDIAKEVLHANNGKEAIDILKDHPDIDVILMDIKMPVLDGLSASREIRKFNKDVIIIAQTAFALAGDKKKALEAGCNDYIAKPIRKKELIKLLFNHIINKEKK